ILERERDVEEWKLAAGAEACMHLSVEGRQNKARIGIMPQIDRKVVGAEMELFYLGDASTPNLARDLGVALSVDRLRKQSDTVDIVEYGELPGQGHVPRAADQVDFGSREKPAQQGKGWCRDQHIADVVDSQDSDAPNKRLRDRAPVTVYPFARHRETQLRPVEEFFRHGARDQFRRRGRSRQKELRRSSDAPPGDGDAQPTIVGDAVLGRRHCVPAVQIYSGLAQNEDLGREFN